MSLLFNMLSRFIIAFLPRSSVQFSCSVVSDSATPWTAARQATQSITDSWNLLKLISLNRWCHLTISSYVIPFSSCLQSFPTSESALHIRRPKYWSFILNTQGWFHLGLTDLISLQSKRLSRVFSSTTIQKHQFFGAPPSLQFNSHICAWLLGKP